VAPAWTRAALVAREAGAIRGVVPGYLERRLGGVWFQGLPLGAPGGPLLAPAHAADTAAEHPQVAAALWAGLARSARAQGWLGGRVTLAPPAAADQALWPPAELGRIRRDEMHVVELAGGPEPWRAGLHRSARRQLTKALRLGVVVEVSERTEDLVRVHALHVAQARGWGLREVRPLAFYRELLTAPTSARLWVARAGGEIVCGVLAFVEPAETYAWWSGSAPAARERGAFPALLAGLIEQCGSRRVSLGFSGGRRRLTDFKEQMGAVARVVPILELAPRPRTPVGALLVVARQLLRGR
jgi:hypothetical protein